MTTDFTYGNKAITTSGPTKPATVDSPNDLRTRVKTFADIRVIPMPYVGMTVTVLADETNNGKMTDYKVLSLKANNLGIPNTVINEIERYVDYLGVSSNGSASGAEIEDVPTDLSLEGTTLKLKKSDGTVIGVGVELPSSEVDLSTISLEMQGQILKIKNNDTVLSSVTIPTATVTDEQLQTIIQGMIDDGTLGALTIEDESITKEKLAKDSVNIEKCNFLEGISNFDNLHKKFTTGVGQGGGNIVVGNSNNVSSIIKVIPNKSYKVTVSGEHDRFRICGINTDEDTIPATTPYTISYINSDTLDTFIIDDCGDINTLVISVSASSQQPNLEVYLNGESDVNFKFPLKADYVKETAIISGSTIINNTIAGEAIIDGSIEPLKTSFLVEGKNKYKGDILTGYAIIASGKGALSYQSNNPSNYIIAYANIKPDTQYTISYPETSEKFRIIELNKVYDLNNGEVPSGGDKLIINDDKLKEFTFTTSTEAKMICIYMSDSGTIHKLQIEENDRKTGYRQYGFKLFDRYIEDITDINMVTDMFKQFIIDKDNVANKFYDCSVLEYNKNITKTQHTDIYTLYDELVTNYPNYVTKEVLGSTTYNNLQINCYKFTPETLGFTNFDAHLGTFTSTGEKRIPKNRQRILICTGTHGDERSSVVGAYTFLKDVCTNPNNNALLERIRREIEIIIIPVVNPTGYNAMSRYAEKSENSYVVDMNRQFTEELLTADTYDGLLNESKIVADFIKANKDTLTAVFDFHNMQPQKGKNLSWFIMDGDNLIEKANKAIIKCSKKWQEKYSFLEQEKGFLFGETSSGDRLGGITGTIQSFAHKLGLNSATIEFTTTIQYDGYNTSYSKEQLNLHLSLLGNLLAEFI